MKWVGIVTLALLVPENIKKCFQLVVSLSFLMTSFLTFANLWSRILVESLYSSITLAATSQNSFMVVTPWKISIMWHRTRIRLRRRISQTSWQSLAFPLRINVHHLGLWKYTALTEKQIKQVLVVQLNSNQLKSEIHLQVFLCKALINICHWYLMRRRIGKAAR